MSTEDPCRCVRGTALGGIVIYQYCNYRGDGLMRGSMGQVRLALDGHGRRLHCLRWTEVLHRVCGCNESEFMRQNKGLAYLNLKEFEGICA